MGRRLIVVIFSALVFLSSLTAQVTIGSTEAPIDGAILDLKDDIAKNNSLGVTAIKGLGLPRVSLQSLNKLQMGKDADDYTSQANLHEGLMVYNVNRTKEFCIGLYVWNGQVWDYLQEMPTPDTSSENLDEQTGLGTLTDREGNVYYVAKFRDQGWWMTQNLGTLTFYDMCKGVLPLSPSVKPSYNQADYMHPGADESSPFVQGLLYNWTAATNFKGGWGDGKGISIDEGEGNQVPNPNSENIEQVGVQGACPKGWHLPSDLEWNRLEEEINNNHLLYTNGYSETPATWSIDFNVKLLDYRGVNGALMQSKNSLNGSEGRSKSASEGGFDALMAGRGQAGVAGTFKVHEYYWSSSASTSELAWRRGITIDNGKGMYRAANDRTTLYSIRCKKD